MPSRSHKWFIVVRNRARELVEMLSDVDKIRAERRKAKANRHKYTGTGNDGLSFGSGGGRYGGFEGGSYSGSGGGGGNSSYDRGQETCFILEFFIHEWKHRLQWWGWLLRKQRRFPR